MLRCFLLIFCIKIGSAVVLKAQQFAPLNYFQDNIHTDYANGISVADYDKDGDLDLFIVATKGFDKNDPKTWNRLYENKFGAFIDVTNQSGLNKDQFDNPNEVLLSEGIKMGASWGDYDNDGYPDLFLTNQGKDQIWHNLGNKTFENVTEIVGVAGADSGYSTSALWWDYDNDGDLDLYVSTWGGSDNAFYRNDGNHTFTNIATQTGLGKIAGGTWTAMPIDVNKDGWQDLYLANDFKPNQLFLNKGEDNFINATDQYNLFDDGNGMGIDITDFNNDGNFDIYVTNIAQVKTNPFFINNGHIFENLGEDLGVGDARWAWGCRFFDFDHDTDEDLYVVNQQYFHNGLLEYNRFFELINGKFEDQSSIYGLANEADSKTLEVFDYNGDGDLDIILGNWGAKTILFDNPLTSDRNWLQVELEGTISNRNAFGTVVRIKTTDGKFQHRLHHGVNFLGQSIKPLHFGLGLANEIEELTVYWASGRTEFLTNIGANQKIKLIEGEHPEANAPMYGTSQIVSITEIENHNLPSIQVWPNPSSRQVYIRTDFSFDLQSEIQISVFNTLGQKCFENSVAASLLKQGISLNRNKELDVGQYILRLFDGNRFIQTKLMIID